MLFSVHYEITPEHRDTALSRFLELGDGGPAGIKFVGNWWSVTQLEGWAIVEGNDAMELAKLLHVWTNLNVNHVTPVLDEKDIRTLIAR